MPWRTERHSIRSKSSKLKHPESKLSRTPTLKDLRTFSVIGTEKNHGLSKMRQFIIQSGKFPFKYFPRHTDITIRRSLGSASLLFESRLSKPSYPSERKIQKFSFPYSALSFSSDSRPDPFARRPTAKCDPYGQSGKPLTLDRVLALKATVQPEWEVLMTETNDSSGDNDDNDDLDPTTFVPFAIRRFYWHDEYLQGAEFSRHVAAVAQMNAQHFPHEVILSRKLESKTKTWKICTEIVCRTHVLQGLSHHDFYLATLIDIEAERPEVRGLLATD